MKTIYKIYFNGEEIVVNEVIVEDCKGFSYYNTYVNNKLDCHFNYAALESVVINAYGSHVIHTFDENKIEYMKEILWHDLWGYFQREKIKVQERMNELHGFCTNLLNNKMWLLSETWKY